MPSTYAGQPSWRDAGPTVWNPYSEVGEYFSGGDHAWIVTFRVRDHEAMVDQLNPGRYHGGGRPGDLSE